MSAIQVTIGQETKHVFLFQSVILLQPVRY